MKITNWTRTTALAIASRNGALRKFNRLLAGGVVGASVAAGAAQADAASITHAVQDPSFDVRNLSGSGNYAYIRTIASYPWVPTLGNNNSWLYNSTYAPSSNTPEPLSNPNSLHLADGNVYQILGENFASGREYTISSWIHWNSDQYVGDNFGFRLFDGTSGTFSGAQVFASEDYLIDTDISRSPGWQQMSMTYTADANADGKPIGIYLGNGAAANRISVDNVSLTSIPEPGTFAILGTGSLVVWQVVRRRRSE